MTRAEKRLYHDITLKGSLGMDSLFRLETILSDFETVFKSKTAIERTICLHTL